MRTVPKPDKFSPLVQQNGQTVEQAWDDFFAYLKALNSPAVSNAAPTNGQILVYNSTTQIYEPKTVASTLSSLTNSLSADVALNNLANYFDGPSVAQGTTGTWFASGTVTLNDTGASASNFYAKLWDGTTVISSANTVHVATANLRTTISLSGVLASPAANIRISVRNLDSTAGVIEFNRTGNSKDSTLTALRIG